MSIDDQTKLLTEIRDILQGHYESLVKIDRDSEDIKNKMLVGSAVQLGYGRSVRNYLVALVFLGVLIAGPLCLLLFGNEKLVHLMGG